MVTTRATGDNWRFDFHDVVDSITLSVRDGVTISIPTAGILVEINRALQYLHGGSTTTLEWPGPSAMTLAPLLSVIGEKLRSIMAEDIVGELRLGFDDGRLLIVSPDDAIEAWSVRGVSGALEGLRIVCEPGGRIAYWGPSPSRSDGGPEIASRP